MFDFNKKPLLPRANKIPKVPNEIWVQTVQFCDLQTLLQLRRVNTLFLKMSNATLRKRLDNEFLVHLEALEKLKMQHEELVKSSAPNLEHYREFLLADMNEFVSELCYYLEVPIEVRVVAQCLLRLYGNANAKTWAEQRKIMKSTDFRLWLNSLPVLVKEIDIKNTRAVEDLIRNDPAITYVRLRAVSMAGYRLLIVVAACLQYSSIQNEVSTSKLTLENFSQICETGTKFMGAIGYNIENKLAV